MKTLITSKETRKLMTSLLRKTRHMINSGKGEGEEILSCSMELIKEMDDLILENRQTVAREIHTHLVEEVSLAYLGIYVFAILSMAAYDEKNPEVGFLPEAWLGSNCVNPNLVFHFHMIHITNHALAVVNLVESGLDNSARVVLRTVQELCNLVPVLITDVEKMRIYVTTKDEDERRAWQTHFSPGKLSSALKKVEENLGVPQEVREILTQTREDNKTFFSKSVHSSYPVSTVLSQCFQFGNEENGESGLLGGASLSSKTTLAELNNTFFIFGGILNKIIRNQYQFKLKNANDLWKIGYSLLVAQMNRWTQLRTKEEPSTNQ